MGLGGRLDSTNVITPELSLITNISFDHQELLGDTLEKIAFEKAGIIKRAGPVIISERQKEVEKVFVEKAASLNAPLRFATDIVTVRAVKTGYDVFTEGKLWIYDLVPELRGSYQRRNLPGILAAVLQLRTMSFVIGDPAIRTGIEFAATLTGLKGRWQTLCQEPLTICDTGHNADGIREVVEQIKATPHRHLHFVLGAVKEKDISGILIQLPKDATYYFCQAKIPRALDALLLEKQAGEFELKGNVIPDVNDALREATRAAGKDDLVFIGGSTFVVAEIEGL